MEFESWWIHFEKIIGVPMGRKLVNAATDEEEFHIMNNNLFECGSLLQKISSEKGIIAARWLQYGWGELQIDDEQILTPTIAPFTVGVALAAIEYCRGSRFKTFLGLSPIRN